MSEKGLSRLICCPTCGQVLSNDDLLALLTVPIEYPPPKRWRGGRRHRSVYRGDKTDLWYITHGRELPFSGPFPGSQVRALVAAGKLVSTYPGEAAAKDSYTLPRQARIQGPNPMSGERGRPNHDH